MPTPTDQTLLIFRIAGIACAVPAESVGSIVMPPDHLTHPPGSGRSTPGIFHHADYTYSVIDLHERFGIDTPRKGIGRLLLKDEGIRHFAFQVDEVVGLVDSEHGQWAALPPYLPNTIFWSGFLYKKEIVLCTELQSLRTMHDAAPLQRHFEVLQQQAEKARAASDKPSTSPSSDERPKLQEKQPTHTPVGKVEKPPAGSATNRDDRAHTTTGSNEHRETPPPTSGTKGAVQTAPPTQARKTAPASDDKPSTAPQREPSRTAPTGPVSSERQPPASVAAASPPRHGASMSRGDETDSPAHPSATTSRRAPETPPPAPTAKPVTPRAVAEPARVTPPPASPPARDDSGGSGGLWLIALLLLLLLSAATYWLWPEPPQKRTIAYAPSPEPTPAPTSTPPAPPAELTPPSPEAAKPKQPPVETAEEEVPMRIERDEEGTLNIIFDRRAIASQESAVPSPDEAAESQEAGMTPLEGEAGITPLASEEETPLLSEAEQLAGTDETPAQDVGTEVATGEAAVETTEPQEPESDWTEPPAVEPCECLHIVVRGDTLWDIAARYTGSAWNYPELARRSGITNPDLIYPGDKVRIIIR